MKEIHEKFFVSQVGILIRDNKCLILEMSKYPGQWHLPGGRINLGEMSEEALRREIKEETGIIDFDINGLIDFDIFYVSPEKPVCGIVQYIDNSQGDVALSEEHHAYKWINENEIEKYSYIWEKAPRMIKKGFEYRRQINKV